MRIGSADGPAIDLAVLGYEFAAPSRTVTERDWDANWLVIKGWVTPDDRPGWSFTAACLTTFEARQLADWLRGVALGEVRPAPFDVERWGESGLLWFTEPALGFSLAASSPEHVAIRVHLSFEALPPGMSPEQLEIYEHFVVVRTTSSELSGTVDDWLQELSAFPVR